MVVNTIKENLCVNKKISTRKEIIFVEGDVIVPDAKPDVLNIICTSGVVCIYKKEMIDEKIKIEGNVDTYIMYMTDDSQERTRGINTSLDLSEVINIPNITSEMESNICTNIKEIEAKKPEQIEIETTDKELHVAKTEVEEFLKEFLEKAKIEAETKVEIKEKCLYVSINGKNVGNLIGYRGDALYALENILKAIANKESENRVIVRLDIENYKQKRVETLKEFAKKKAAIVEKTGKILTLEPMKAYERKIIHSALQDNPNVETRSIGQEPKRRIVITKKDN